MSFKVIGVGEVLWDLLPSGAQLGGAPANFAYHARQLGADARVISRVGNDASGREIIRRIQEMGVAADGLQVDASAPTGTVSVSLSPAGVPSYAVHENVAWDGITATPEAFSQVRRADAVCFGTLAQRHAVSRCAIQALAAAAAPGALRVYDINLRQRFYSREMIERSLRLANVLKLNDQELAVLSPMFSLMGGADQKIRQLASLFGLQLVALTRGEHGSALYRSPDWSELPGSRTEVIDTVGAGDAFTAAMVIGLLQRFPLAEIHRLATEVAGFVCSRPGATPALPAQLRAAFLTNGLARPQPVPSVAR